MTQEHSTSPNTEAPSLGETDDGNEIIYQCPECKQVESFRANFVGTYDMDASGCWDDWTKYRDMQLAEGEYEFIECKECGHSGSYAEFRCRAVT